jgi:type I thyroxine 5'-deiodinase
VAEQCAATLKLSLPTLVDRDDNAVNRAYAAWPDRLYVVGTDGRIAYQGAPGPKGFKIHEVEEWLKRHTAPRPPGE